MSGHMRRNLILLTHPTRHQREKHPPLCEVEVSDVSFQMLCHPLTLWAFLTSLLRLRRSGNHRSSASRWSGNSRSTSLHTTSRRHLAAGLKQDERERSDPCLNIVILVLIAAVICWLQLLVYNNVSINKCHGNGQDVGWSFHVEFFSLAPARYISILGSPLRSPNLNNSLHRCGSC